MSSIIYNDIIPPTGFKAITIGWIFVRKGTILSVYDLHHEQIHQSQQREMLYLPFFVWYAIEWVVRMAITMVEVIKGECDTEDWMHEACRSISFEHEAYYNQYDMDYLGSRRPWSFLKYIKG